MSGGSLRDRINAARGGGSEDAPPAPSGGGSLRDRLNSFGGGGASDALQVELAPDEPSSGDAGQIIAEPEQPETSWASKLGSAAVGAGDSLTFGAPRLIPGVGDWIDERERENPGWFKGGEIAGAVGNPLNFVGVGEGLTAARLGIRAAGSVAQKAAARGAFRGALAETAAREAANSGVQGGLSSFFHADPEQDLGERAGGALADAGSSALYGGLGSAAMGAGGRLVDAAGDALRESGYITRAKAAGIRSRPQIKAVGGDAGMAELGQQIEEKGLHKGDGALGWLPQPAKTYGANAGELLESSGPRMGAAEDAISQLPQPPVVDVTQVTDPLRDKAQQLAGLGNPAARKEAALRGRFADQLEGVSQGSGNSAFMDFEQALKERRFADKQVKWAREGGAPLQEDVQRDVANNLRAGIKGSLDDGVQAGNVPAPLRDQWVGANDDYHLASQLEKPAALAEAADQSRKPFSLGGALAGGAVGMFGGPVSAGSGAVLGAASNLAAPRAQSAIAGTKGGIGATLQGVGRLSAGLADYGGATAATGLDRARNAPAPHAAEAEPVDRTTQKTTDAGRGNLLGDAAIDLLRHNPAQLGQYQSQFAEAYSASNAGAVNALISKLAGKDPQFRTGVMAQLQRMTAEQ